MMNICFIIGLRSPGGQGPCLLIFESPTNDSDLQGFNLPQLQFPHMKNGKNNFSLEGLF